MMATRHGVVDLKGADDPESDRMVGKGALEAATSLGQGKIHGARVTKGEKGREGEGNVGELKYSGRRGTTYTRMNNEPRSPAV